MIDPISQAIDRQLSQRDRRLLVNQAYFLFGYGFEVNNAGLSDGGFNVQVIEQAIDISLMKARHNRLWDGNDTEPSNARD